MRGFESAKVREFGFGGSNREPPNPRTPEPYLGDATLPYEWNAYYAGRFEFSSLPRGPLGGVEIPPRRLVAARGALQRHASMLEMEQRVVSVKPADELPNLVRNHCAETPFLSTYPV